MMEEFKGRTAKFQKNGKTYYVFYDKSGVRKGIYGDGKSDKGGLKAKINIGADGNYNVLINVKDTGRDNYVYDITLKEADSLPNHKGFYDGNSPAPRSSISQNKKNTTVDTKFSLKMQVEETKNFKKEYDLWDGIDPTKHFVVGTTSEAMKKIGISDKKIVFDSSKIIKIKNKHKGMTDQVIKNVTDIINEPVVIMESQTVPGRITMFGHLKDNKGKPVLVALELKSVNKNNIMKNEIKVVSAYGKDNVQGLIDRSEILYVCEDIKKTKAFLSSTRLQLPVETKDFGLIKTISQTKENTTVDTKFSLKMPMEETKNLIAVHNLTEEKLEKTLALGGFPMPSIAVTKTDISHTNFGSISCVFRKETIDPKKKANKVYGADAWTPTFPMTEYEANSDIARGIEQKIGTYAENLPEDYKRQAKGFVSGLEYNLDHYGGKAGMVGCFFLAFSRESEYNQLYHNIYIKSKFLGIFMPMFQMNQN